MRIALVTGGASGLGLATAKRFAKDGMIVAVADLKAEAAEAAAASLPGEGHRGFALDVTDEAAVKKTFGAIESEVGPISVLAQFAGTLGNGSMSTAPALADTDLDDWDFTMGVNARGTMICIREMAWCRRAKPVEHGRIITVSSLAGQIGGLQSGVNYTASKAAVLGLTRFAARALAKEGITVNAIAPGPIDTPMLAQATGATADGTKYTKMDAIPLGRVGHPDEIAHTASFLADPLAGFITGVTIGVNGGLFIA